MGESRWEPENGDLAALRRHAARLRTGDPGGVPSDAVRTADLIDELTAHQVELKLQNEALQEAYEELNQANDELAQSNEALEESRDRYHHLYDYAPVGYATLDASGTIVEANSKLAAMLGTDLHELQGRRFVELVIENDQDDCHRFLRSMAAEQRAPETLDVRLRRPEGGALWVRTHWSVMDAAALQDGSCRTRVAIADISDYKSMQAQVAQADRMASIGLLAAGVAHEVNNPLTYVLYNLESLAHDLPELRARIESGATGDLDDMLDRARSAVEGAHRIRDIVKHLRIFSHMDDGRIEPTTIAGVIDTAIDMAFNEFKYRARLVKRYGDVPRVDANAGQLCQVFLNLLVNAAHAIQEGNIERNEIRIRTRENEGDVVVDVEDTGEGIPPENLGRVFEPFFTTRPIGTGSGLGLSICQKIITDLGGEMSVKSRVGRGTCFTMRIPVADSRKTGPTGTGTGTPRHVIEEQLVPGRVLVIDDEPMIGKVSAQMLKGHEVLVADSGSAGREVLARDQRFDVILCDLMMPGFTGMDLYQWLADEHPELTGRIVFVTGGAFTPRAGKLLKEVPNLRLQKPFRREMIRTLVQKMILAERGKATTT